MSMVSSFKSGKRVCVGVRADGVACRAFAVVGSDLCRAHKVASEGGSPFRVRGRPSYDPTELRLSTKRDMLRFVEYLLRERMRAIKQAGKPLSSADLQACARLLGPFINVSKLPDDKVKDAKVTKLADLMRLADAS